MSSPSQRPARILYVQYFNPGAYPPLEHGARILAREGVEVLVLGIGAPLGAGELKWTPEPGVRVARLPYCAPGWLQKFHYALFAAWIFSRAVLFRPAIIYGSDWLSCPTLLWLGLFWTVVYHEHDIPLAALTARSQTPTENKTRTAFIRFVLWSRAKVAKAATFCVAPNEGRAEALRRTTGTKRPILSVWNCPSRDEIIVDSRRRVNSDKVILFYHGSIVPERLPLTVLAAVAQLSGNVRLQVAGYETIGYPGYADVLRNRARHSGISDYVDFLGPMSRSDLLKQCCLADVGLAVLPPGSPDFNQETMVGASNKPFDYLACGLALLVGDAANWRELYVAKGYGLSCDSTDPHSIAAALRWFYSNPEEMSAMGRRGQTRIRQDWNYETQFAEVRDRLLGFLETRRQ